MEIQWVVKEVRKKMKDIWEKLKDFHKKTKDLDRKLKKFCPKLSNLATLSWWWLLKNGQKKPGTLSYMDWGGTQHLSLLYTGVECTVTLAYTKNAYMWDSWEHCHNLVSLFSAKREAAALLEQGFLWGFKNMYYYWTGELSIENYHVVLFSLKKARTKLCPRHFWLMWSVLHCTVDPHRFVSMHWIVVSCSKPLGQVIQCSTHVPKFL